MCFCGVNRANSAISSLIGIQGYPHCVATRSWMWSCGVKNQGHPPSASRHVFGSAHVLLWCGLHNARDILHDRSHKKTQLFRDSFLTSLLRNMQTQFRNFFRHLWHRFLRNLRHGTSKTMCSIMRSGMNDLRHLDDFFHDLRHLKHLAKATLGSVL